MGRLASLTGTIVVLANAETTDEGAHETRDSAVGDLTLALGGEGSETETTGGHDERRLGLKMWWQVVHVSSNLSVRNLARNAWCKKRHDDRRLG